MSFTWNGGSGGHIMLPNANFWCPQTSSQRFGEATAENDSQTKNHKRASDTRDCVDLCPGWTVGFLVGQCNWYVATLTCCQG